MIAAAPTSRLLRWQAGTVALMVSGYAGYYLCRSNLSVTLPLIVDDLARQGVKVDAAKIRLGAIASAGVLAYAAGKIPSGGLADFLGGKRNFLLGMAGSILFTFLFALGGGLPLMTFAWTGNRLAQSLGWAGIVKIASRWFSYSSYGTAMGIISLSFLFGDALARQFIAILIARGMSWQAIFLVTGGVLLVLLAVNAWLLRETPREIGEPEPQANRLSLFEQKSKSDLRSLIRPFLHSKTFWLVCLLSLGTTLVRETFSLWTPAYFSEALGMSHAGAAQRSALFPLLGGVSVIVAGWLSDKLGPRSRSGIILGGLLLSGFALLALAYSSSPSWAVALVGLVALLTTGPYSYLAGAISLDFGGKHAAGTASGIIDAVGYAGGVFAGDSIARISVSYGWRGAFAFLAVVSWASSAVAGFYFLSQRRVAK